MNKPNLGNYLFSGSPSGWTSGMLSGYVKTSVSQLDSGVNCIQAQPRNLVNGEPKVITVTYREDGIPQVAIWQSTGGISPQTHVEIRNFLFGVVNDDGKKTGHYPG